MKTKDQKHRPQPEDPGRLREVLNALIATCSNEVYRLEALVCDDGFRIILTCSNQTKEEEIGKILIRELKSMGFGNIEKTGESKEWSAFANSPTNSRSSNGSAVRSSWRARCWFVTAGRERRSRIGPRRSAFGVAGKVRAELTVALASAVAVKGQTISARSARTR